MPTRRRSTVPARLRAAVARVAAFGAVHPDTSWDSDAVIVAAIANPETGKTIATLTLGDLRELGAALDEA